MTPLEVETLEVIVDLLAEHRRYSVHPAESCESCTLALGVIAQIDERTRDVSEGQS